MTMRAAICLITLVTVFAAQSADAASGDLDLSFDSGLGYSSAAFDLGGSNQDLVTSVLAQSTGNLVLVGTAADASSTGIALARFHPDGSPDPSFGTNGKSVISTAAITGTSVPYVYGAALDSSDGIYVTGHAGPFGVGSIGFVARITANGQLAAFSTQGFFVFSDTIPEGIAVDHDDKPVVVGVYASNNGYELFVARLTADGALDAAFHGGSPLTQAIGAGPPFYDRAGAVTFDASGRIYLAAARETSYNAGTKLYLIQPAIVRLTASGTLDTTCNQTGFIVAPFGDASILPASILFRDAHHGIWTGANGSGSALLAYDFDADDCSGGTAPGQILGSAKGGYATTSSDGSVFISYTSNASPTQSAILTLHDPLPYSAQAYSVYPSAASTGESVVTVSGQPLQAIRQQVSGTNYDFVVARFQNDRIFYANLDRDAPN